MASEKHAPGGPRKVRISLSMEELDASLDSFLVEPPRRSPEDAVVAAEATFELNCTNAATCNFKCGPTAYWECYTTPEWGCAIYAE